MRYPLAFFVILFALFLFADDAVMAQTPTPGSESTPLSSWALRKQDRQECTKQVAQQNIAKRNQAEFIRKCMGDRQGARKAAAKKKTSGQ
jgi:hypothetical protein